MKISTKKRTSLLKENLMLEVDKCCEQHETADHDVRLSDAVVQKSRKLPIMMSDYLMLWFRSRGKKGIKQSLEVR
jgi:hypothetical protein